MSSEPSRVVEALVDRVTLLRNGDLAQVEPLVNLYAVDAVVAHPMQPIGPAVIRGRHELREHFENGLDQIPPTDSAVEDLVVHTTADPEVVIAEFRYVGRVEDRPLDTHCIFVVRVRHGEIVESRDYVDHVASARSYGRLPSLIAELEASMPHHNDGQSPDRAGDSTR